jgi:HAD superfamily hydrolase (TIGR01509 family)
VPDLYAKINRERDVFEPFDICILSCEVGLIKPQKEIFELAIRKLDLKPEECVLIDDREKYLSVPRDMGFRVIRYKGNKKLIEELKVIGVF